MKKNYFINKIAPLMILLFILIKSPIVFAQVGIGTDNPDPSAILDIKSDKAGVLLPHVTLQSLKDNKTVNAPAEGLLIYNDKSNPQKHLNNSFYIWDGEQWDKIQSQRDADEINERIDSLKTSIGNGGSGNSWNLKGNNLGWNGSSDTFLGSTTYAELNFRVDDKPIAKFHPNGGVSLGMNSKIDNAQRSFALGEESDASGNQDAFAIGTKARANTNKSVALGYNSETNQTNAFAIGVNSKADGTSSFAVGSGAHATATDSYALGTGASSTSSASIAIGQNSKSTNVNSLALGVEANASNQFSTAMGYKAVSSGMRAMAIGYGSKASGNNSIAYGYQATSEGTNSIAIGYGANAPKQYSVAIGYGAQTKQDHTVIIGNAGYDTNGSQNSWYKSKVGIGTYSPEATLDLHGSFKLVDGSEGAGKVLTSDGNGNASWKNVSPGKNFETSFNLGDIGANGGSTIIQVNIPQSSRPSSTKATVVVTPENNLNDNIYVAWSKLSSTNKLRIKLINTGANPIYNPYNKFYISIDEF